MGLCVDCDAERFSELTKGLEELSGASQRAAVGMVRACPLEDPLDQELALKDGADGGGLREFTVRRDERVGLRGGQSGSHGHDHCAGGSVVTDCVEAPLFDVGELDSSTEAKSTTWFTPSSFFFRTCAATAFRKSTDKKPSPGRRCSSRNETFPSSRSCDSHQDRSSVAPS